MSKLSSAVKYMCRISTDHKFILVVTDEVTNYLATIPLYKGTLHYVGEALINHVFFKHSPTFYLIFDKDQVFYLVFM